jgi:hypothetical protein
VYALLFFVAPLAVAEDAEERVNNERRGRRRQCGAEEIAVAVRRVSG